MCIRDREDTDTMVTVYCSTGRPLDWNPQLSAETGRPVPVSYTHLISFDVRREVCGAYHLIKADSYRGNYFFSFYNEDDEEQSAKIFEYAIKDDRLTPVEELSLIHI